MNVRTLALRCVVVAPSDDKQDDVRGRKSDRVPGTGTGTGKVSEKLLYGGNVAASGDARSCQAANFNEPWLYSGLKDGKKERVMGTYLPLPRPAILFLPLLSFFLHQPSTQHLLHHHSPHLLSRPGRARRVRSPLR